ncbi:MAG: TlpA disulfide reductase family protein [Bacteroidales bacterium]
MKTSFLSLFFFLLLPGNSIEAQIPWKEDTAIIAGKIENLDKHPDIFSVSLICNPVYDYEYNTRSVYINPDGSFQFRIAIAYPQEVLLVPEGVFGLLIIPGDSIFVKIDANFLDDSLGHLNRKKYIDFESGPLAQENRDLTIFNDEISKRLNHLLLQKICKEQGPDVYKRYIDARTDSCWLYLKEFQRKYDPSGRFMAWAQDEIIYNRLNELMRYWWYHPALNGQVNDSSRYLPDEYFSFLREYNPEDFNIISYSHTYFLHEYFNYSMSFPFEDRQKLKESYRSGAVKGCIKENEMILKNSSGSTRNILLTKRFFLVLAGKDPAIFDSVYTTGIITDPFLTALIDKAYRELKDYLAVKKTDPGSRLNPAVNAKPGSTLDTLLARYRGKVVYIDFWAPWCGPCMGEMPASKELQAHFAGKEVVFIFLGNQCKEDAWKGTIANAKITGEHYLLNNEQYKNLAARFNFSGIPHYVLVNRNGEVVDANAPRPSQKEVIGKAINELLGVER